MTRKHNKKRYKSKKKAPQKPEEEPTFDKNIPRSFVIRRGSVGSSIKELEQDLRNLMQPYTATRLQERRTNTVKDFINVAGPLGIKNILLLSSTEAGAYLRVVRVPQGPTLTFRIVEYSLMGDLARQQSRLQTKRTDFRTPPLVVMNNFGANNHFKLAATMFRGLFPAINVHTTKLKDCRRVLLLNYDAERDVIEWRHYRIVVRPVGISRAVKTVVTRRAPALGHLADVADYVLGGNASDSEGDELVDSKVVLPGAYPGPGNSVRPTRPSHRSAVRCREIGPRMTLKLIKVQDGAGGMGGPVLYHALRTLTKEEKLAMLARRAAKAALKAERRREQDANVKRKRLLQQQQQQQQAAAGADADDARAHGDDEDADFEEAFAENNDDDDDDDSEKVAADDDDDDIAWYRRQVGEEPTDDFRETAASRAAQAEAATDGDSNGKKSGSGGALWFKTRRDEKKAARGDAPTPTPANDKRERRQRGGSDKAKRGGANGNAASGNNKKRGFEGKAGRANKRPRR